jgi:hypothetical protein
MSWVPSGHPSVENGHRPEENQVSSTSGSWTSLSVPARATASPASWATKTRPSSVYHAGIWWPHQSWREMHQGLMFSSQWSQVLTQVSGSRDRRPSCTASMACLAMPVTSQNHCVETRGSIGSPLRWLWPT